MSWQEIAAVVTAIGFLFTIAAVGWRLGGLLKSIDSKIDIAMVLIKRHDEMLSAASESRRELHVDVQELRTWVQVHEQRHIQS